MLQVFSIFSVSLWQNYSATYWSGMYTTPFCVSSSGFVCTQICLRKNEENKKTLDKERVGFVWMSLK